MKKAIIFVLITAVFSLSCGYRGYLRWFRPKYSIQEVLEAKAEIDGTDNPARKRLIEKRLREGLVSLEKVLVKDIIVSANIDYEFGIVVEIPSEKGNVECYIYSKNVYEKEDIKSVARLEKGRSVIDVLGEFSRFFTLLDDYYTRIEIVNSYIVLRGDK